MSYNRSMIVVTGANGFIGSNVVVTLHGRGDAMLHVDDYPSLREAPEPTTQAPPELRYERFEGVSYLHYEALPGWLRTRGHSGEVAGVVHLGACSDTRVTDRDYIMRVNFEFTRTLWAWCGEACVPFVYASSAATYGDGSCGYDDRADPAGYQPLNLYGESKHRFDLWALSEGQQQAPPRWAGLKYFNVYGPRETHKGRMLSVPFRTYYEITQTGRATLLKSHKEGVADGEQKRDFVYVRDAVDATLFLLETPTTATSPNGLYNIGTGEARSFLDLAKAVFAAVEKPVNVRYVPMPEDMRERYQYFTQAEVSKLRSAGYTKPFHSIEAGVKAYAAWLKQQPATASDAVSWR